jgi:hypothetical protein
VKFWVPNGLFAVRFYLMLMLKSNLPSFFLFSFAVLFSTTGLVSAQMDTLWVEVSGKILSTNGQTKVPVGLFGVNASNFTGFSPQKIREWGIESARFLQSNPPGSSFNPPSPIPQVVDGWYDSWVPPLNVENPTNWKSSLFQKASQYVASLNGLNREVILEFWNQPSLNWAFKPGISTDPAFYDTSGRYEGGPVRLKGTTTPEPFLKWKNALWYSSPNWATNRDGVYKAISTAWDQQMALLGIPFPGLTGVLNPGQTYFPGTNREFSVINTLRPVDTTQLSYYSSSQNQKYYSEMFWTLADTMHLLRPGMMVSAGWGIEPHKDNWATWKSLFKPLIDQNISRLDAIHEQHRAMDTRIIAAGYEVMNAYARTRFNKNLKFLTTETEGYLDPQFPNRATLNSGNVSLRKKAFNSYTYHTKDILYMLANCPDKAYSRAIHEPQNTNEGARFALENLKTLRGNLLECVSSGPNLCPVATLSGDTLLTVVCFNQYPKPKKMGIRVAAPAGLSFESGITQLVDTTEISDTLGFRVNAVDVTPQHVIAGAFIEPLQTITWKFRMAGTATLTDTVKVRQFFCDSLLTHVKADTSINFQLSVPASVLAGFPKARLKCVIMNGPAPLVTFNGTPLFYFHTGDSSEQNRGGISYATLPDQLVSENNTINVSTFGNTADVWLLSVELSNTTFVSEVAATIPVRQVQLFPNPCTDDVQIAFPSESGKGTVSLFNLQGKEVLSKRMDCEESRRGLVRLSTEKLPSGLYTGRISFENKAIPSVFKLVKE